MKKNMMKYAVAAMAAMMISGALTACGGSDKKAETTVAVETTAEETEAVDGESTEAADAESTEAADGESTEAADGESTEAAEDANADADAAAEEETEAEAVDAAVEVEETTAAN